MGSPPAQNGFCETFNGRRRDECLNQHWFLSLPRLDEAQPHAAHVGPGIERAARQLRPVVHHDLVRVRAALADHRSSMRATRSPESNVSTSIASA
jgi:transposase InsO family protein